MKFGKPALHTASETIKRACRPTHPSSPRAMVSGDEISRVLAPEDRGVYIAGCEYPTTVEPPNNGHIWDLLGPG
jgi:hypothetical protein